MWSPSRPKPGPGRSRGPDAAERPGTFGWVRDALSGLALERRGRHLHVVLHERRRALAPDVPALLELRAELGTRLIDLEGDAHASHAMRHLVLVHDTLGQQGWLGIESLPARVVALARVQAEMLASRDPSPLLAVLIERLGLIGVAAEVREGRMPEVRVGPAPHAPAAAAAVEEEPATMPETPESRGIVEVSETNFDEFELMERSWAGTMPGGLGRPDPTA